MEQSIIAQKLLNEENGTMLARAAVRRGLKRSELSKMVKSGVLERADRGVYVRTGELEDEMYSLQQRARKIVYSHETALFLHGLTDRTPATYSITVPSTYKSSPALKERCKIFYIKPELIDLGKEPLPTGMGHYVIAYDAERTLCDVVRSRNKTDRQIMLESLKNYVAGKTNLNKLSDYSKKLGIYRILFQYMEVLL
jgi:Predicted transcriptional regulator